MRVAFGSGRSRLVGFSDEAFRSMDVARIVAFGSNVCGAINKPPSNVQNFWPSSGYVRLHLGQLFIHTDLLNRSQIGHKHKRGKSNRLNKRALIRTGFGELLGGSAVAGIEFERALVRTNSIVFLLRFKVTVAHPFKAKHAGELFLVA